MNCECCNCEYDNIKNKNDRFCSLKCARSYATKKKRSEINQKVSEKLKGNSNKKGIPWSESRRNNHKVNYEACKKAGKLIKERAEKYFWECYNSLLWEEFTKLFSQKVIKNRLILKEQDFSCNKCKLKEWNGVPIIFELHHKDGDKENVSRDNLECLCPNCHSQTDNWRKRKMRR